MVGEPVLAQGFEILWPEGGGSARHELGKLREGLLARGEFGAAIVVFDVLGQLRVAGFNTEILPVCLDSIEATVGPGNHGGEYFAFGT